MKAVDAERGLSAILLLTYSNNERYVMPAIAALDYAWKRHPPVWVVTDTGNFSYKKKLVTPIKQWTVCTHGGLKQLLSQNHILLADYVLLLLEDHVPITQVVEAQLHDVVSFAAKVDAKFVGLFGHGKGIKVGNTQDGLGIYETDPEFKYYSELHPAIWQVGHLCEMLEYAAICGCDDPWNFEFLRLPGVTHLTADKIWPSEFSGFLKEGFVRIRVAWRMKEPYLRPLQRMLVGNWLRQLPAMLKHYVSTNHHYRKMSSWMWRLLFKGQISRIS